MEANGIHLPPIRNIKTLMGAFGFSDGLTGKCPFSGQCRRLCSKWYARSARWAGVSLTKW
jgi:hypothetical protein